MGTFTISHLYKKNKRELDTSDDEQGGGTGQKKKKKKVNRRGHGETVRNHGNLPSDYALKSNEKFGDIFHPEIKKAYKGNTPKLGDEEICQRFHSLGVCHSECKFKNTHKQLPADAADDFRKFCLFCKDEKKRRNAAGK